jgi:hypothetical protein
MLSADDNGMRSSNSKTLSGPFQATNYSLSDITLVISFAYVRSITHSHV